MKIPLLILAVASLINGLIVNVPEIPTGSGPINSHFTGLAIEWFGIRDLFLQSPFRPPPLPENMSKELPSRLNLGVIQLIQNIASLNKAEMPMVIRIGGNSAQRLWVKNSLLARDVEQTDEVDDFDFQILDLVAQLTGVKFILAIGMPTPQPSNTQEIIDLIKRNMNLERILAIAVGNEPDHFYRRWRNPGYTVAEYFQEYDVYAQLIRSQLNNIDLLGPSYAFTWRDEGYQIPFIQAKYETTKYAGFHRYEVRGCAADASMDQLLDSPHSTEYEWVSELSAAGNAVGVQNVWSEGGTASCGGVNGISDAFGSALWIVDILFDMASRGLSFANLAGAPQAVYAPFTVILEVLDVRPTYYAMILFNTVLNGPNTIVYSPSATGAGLRLKSWGAYDTVTRVHTIVIVHKSNILPDEPITVNVAGSGPMIGQLIELTSSSIIAIDGHSIAGLGFDGTLNGLPNSENYQQQILTPAAGAFTFTTKMGSVSLLKVYPSSDTPPNLYDFQPTEWMVNAKTDQQNDGFNARGESFGLQLRACNLFLVTVFLTGLLLI